MHQLGFCRYNLLITSVGWAILSESSVSFAHSTCLKHNWCTASPKALQITNNVVYYLPRNLNLDGVMSLGIPFEVRIFLSEIVSRNHGLHR